MSISARVVIASCFRYTFRRAAYERFPLLYYEPKNILFRLVIRGSLPIYRGVGTAVHLGSSLRFRTHTDFRACWQCNSPLRMRTHGGCEEADKAAVSNIQGLATSL